VDTAGEEDPEDGIAAVFVRPAWPPLLLPLELLRAGGTNPALFEASWSDSLIRKLIHCSARLFPCSPEQTT
jgi:hypothetical protein